MAWRNGAVALGLWWALVGAAEVKPGPQLEAHVRFLADDLLEGRATGTRGHEIAARYVAAQFAALGLEPAGGGGSWLQRIAFEERRFASKRETMLVSGGGAPPRLLVNGEDVTFAPGDAEGAEKIEGELVFVGYGLRSARLGIDDYAGLDLKGKVAVALSGAPKALDGEIGAHLGRSKTSAALAAGAIGMIQVRTLTAAGQRPWRKVAETARLPRRGWLSPAGKPGGEAVGLRFNAAVDSDLEALFAGGPRTLAAIQAEAATGNPRGFALARRIRLDRATAVKPLSSPNVIARLPGRGGGGEAVLAMAHLDHLGIREGGAGDNLYNGAMDNASGIAVLLETARRLKAGRPLRRDVIFMATTAEEGGLQGAEYFAAHPTRPLAGIVAAVNLDMPILTCDFADVIAYGAARSTLEPLVAAAARDAGVTASPDPQPIEAIFTRSDHYPLIKAGIPAVFLKTGWRDRRGGMGCQEADQGFRRTHYHEPSDDLAIPFDWTAAERFTVANAGLVRRIAEARTRPLWRRGDFFGESFAPGVAKAPAK